MMRLADGPCAIDVAPGPRIVASALEQRCADFQGSPDSDVFGGESVFLNLQRPIDCLQSLVVSLEQKKHSSDVIEIVCNV